MADDIPQFSRGDVISSRFEIERLLGEGTLGATYMVRHIKSGKHLALKFMRPRFVRPDRLNRFKNTIRAARELKHDGIVRYGDVGEHSVNGQEFIYFSQEYFPGDDLRALLDEYQQEQKSFTLQEACQIILKVLDALEYLHGQGMVHSHLKPENVIIRSKSTGPGGKKIVRTVKVSDAGMARMLAATGADDGSSYRAPELGLGAGTPPSDVYSVGVMLYELLVGQTPRGTYLSPTQLRGDLPEDIDDIVEIALAGNAEDRYPTPRDMAAHIKRAFSGESFDDGPATSLRTVMLVVGVAILAIAAGGFYVINYGSGPTATEIAQGKDKTLRDDVQAKNARLSESEMAALKEQHPEMLYIPEGPVLMGRLHQEDLSIASQSEPLAIKKPVGAFYIDRFEFPNRTEEKPVAKVSFEQAAEACSESGKRLCTEQEWEKACKGPGSWIYSYGDAHDAEMCGDGVDDRNYAIGDHDTCVSGYGVWGMSGGPREWTESKADNAGKRRVVKGGLRGNSERGTRCAFAVDESANYADSTLSFRCCLDADAPAPAPAPEGDAPANE